MWHGLLGWLPSAVASSSDGSHVVKFRMIVSSDVTEDDDDDDRTAPAKNKATAGLGEL